MIAKIIVPFNGSPQFPQEFRAGWHKLVSLYDAQGNVTHAELAIDATEELCEAVRNKQYAGVVWIGYCDPDLYHNLSLPEDTAMSALNMFKVVLQSLTRDGYIDSVLGHKIKGDERAVIDRWTPCTTNILNALNRGAVTESSPFTTTDYNDLPISMTIGEYQDMMVRFGFWFNNKFNEAAASMALVA